jgi:hypothetical protein
MPRDVNLVLKNFNKEDNLITLCHWCNLRANLNRDYWENYYKQKMEVLK